MVSSLHMPPTQYKLNMIRKPAVMRFRKAHQANQMLRITLDIQTIHMAMVLQQDPDVFTA